MGKCGFYFLQLQWLILSAHFNNAFYKPARIQMWYVIVFFSRMLGI